MAPLHPTAALGALALTAAGTLSSGAAFVLPQNSQRIARGTPPPSSAIDLPTGGRCSSASSALTPLRAAEGDAETEQEVKAAPMVTGEQLEIMLTDWDEPLVVDAYATWCVCDSV